MIRRWACIVVAIGFGLAAGVAGAAGKEPQYVGAKKCKVCHMSKKKGAQYKIWEGSKHAGAYATLATAEAKTAAQKAGVEGDPQQSEGCLKCHGAAGVDAKLVASSYDVSLGVQCESCHGGGSAHVDNMKQRMKTKDESIPTALTVMEAKAESCTTKCHNVDSPTYKSFDFEESWKQIAHPLPE